MTKPAARTDPTSCRGARVIVLLHSLDRTDRDLTGIWTAPLGPGDQEHCDWIRHQADELRYRNETLWPQADVIAAPLLDSVFSASGTHTIEPSGNALGRSFDQDGASSADAKHRHH